MAEQNDNSAKSDGQTPEDINQTLLSLNHDLKERVKELNCLYEICRIIEKSGSSLDEILQDIVDIISQAWQYPEITGVRISLNGRQFTTQNFKQTEWKQASDIVVNNEKKGFLEVCYLQHRLESYEGPFLLEERKLIDAITERLGCAIERIQDKELLRQSEQRYKTIFQNAAEGIIIVDIETKKFKYVNPAICKLLGYSQKELEQMNIADIHPRENLEYVFSKFEAQAKGTISLAADLPCLRKDRTIVYVNINASEIIIDRKKCLVGFFSDITEKKQAQDNLKVSEIRFRTLAEAAFEGIAIHENRRIFDVNQRFVEMFGYTLEELSNMDGTELVAPDFRDTVKEYIDAGRKESYETIGFKKDGSTFPMEVHAREMQSQGHTFRIAAVRDITLRKQFEAEHERYKEIVFKAQKHAYISSLGAIVAHQVNQPLTKINILLDRAREQVEEASCCPSVLKNIKEGLAEAKEAASIIRKFRQYSKDSSLGSVGNVKVSVTADRIVSVLSERAKQAKMRISVEGLRNLPEVETNENALEQIFLIIIQNAIEATDGQKSYKLDITGKFTDGNIELQFADDCCGIAPENIDRIFEPFFSTKTEDKGMGLGLDIVQQLLISCGGQIRVESQLGKGTTFYITLPISNTQGGTENDES